MRLIIIGILAIVAGIAYGVFPALAEHKVYFFLASAIVFVYIVSRGEKWN